MRNYLADTAFVVDCSATSAAPQPSNGQPAAPTAGEPSPLLVDEPAAAAMLNVSPRTMFDLRKKGLIRHVSIPGVRGIRYSTKYLTEWIAAHTK